MNPLVLAALALLGAPPVPGTERLERIEALYAHRLLSDRDGEPLVTIGLAEGANRVEVRPSAPTELLPEAEEAFRVMGAPGTRWVVTVAHARPARLRYWTLAERFTPRGFEAAAAARRRFSEAGVTTGVFETGALAGMAGRLFDTRSISLAVAPGGSFAEARARLAAARAAGPISFIAGEPFVEVVRRPGGVLVARDAVTGFEVQARDLMWFRPPTGALTEIVVGNGEPHRHGGELYVTVGNDGRLVLGNLAGVELVLEGVVPSETFVTAPLEALKVQAVAARGQFLGKLGLQHRDDPFMLCNRWHCQADGGQGRATAATTAAVRSTRGEILTHPGGGVVDTVYHSACGGRTESWVAVWGGEGRTGLGGVDDRPRPADGGVEALLAGEGGEPYCAASARKGGVHRWLERPTGAQVSAQANRLAHIGPVIDLRITRRGRSGRVLAIEAIGRLGRVQVEGDPAVRRLLGGLKSTLFVLEREGPAATEPAHWLVRGGGYGHGVGLCQHGAIGMANAGLGYRQILGHYFPGTRLEKAW